VWVVIDEGWFEGLIAGENDVVTMIA